MSRGHNLIIVHTQERPQSCATKPKFKAARTGEEDRYVSCAAGSVSVVRCDCGQHERRHPAGGCGTGHADGDKALGPRSVCDSSAG
jgi:hypothetical protein